MQASIEQAKKKLREYKDRGNNGEALRVLDTGPGEVERGPCHGFLRNSGTRECIAVVSRIKRNRKGGEHSQQQERLGSESCIAYYDWLFNRSPWSSCFRSRSASKAWEEECVVLRTDQPANIFQGALISTRNTWEYADNIKVWHELVKEGVDENIAFLSCHLCSYSSGEVVPSSVHRDHVAVSTRNLCKVGAKAFVARKPLYVTGKWNEGGNYQGVLRAWEGEGAPIFESFKNEFNSFGQEESTIKNPFAKAKPSRSGSRSMSVKKYAAFVKDYFNKLLSA